MSSWYSDGSLLLLISISQVDADFDWKNGKMEIFAFFSIPVKLMELPYKTILS